MKKNLILIFFMVFSTWSLKAQEVFSPYEEADSAGLLARFNSTDLLRKRLARIDSDLLDATYHNVSEGNASELTLNLFPDESFTAIVNYIDRNPRHRMILEGGLVYGHMTYTPQNTGNSFFSFSIPHEFAHYMVIEIKDEVVLITKLPWDSPFSTYEGNLTPDKSQISGIDYYRLMHINNDEILSNIKSFQDGKGGSIVLSFLADVRAVIRSVIPSQDSPGDYKITLDIPGGRQTENNTFDLHIVDDKVASMEITYHWALSSTYYRVIPFDKADGVYIITEEIF